jgi:hydrogenase maturation protein HypF
MPAIRMILNGRVQGLGVRPAIYRLATSLGLAGEVRNSARGVEIDLVGNAADLAAFQNRLEDQLPPGALVEQRLVEQRLVEQRLGEQDAAEQGLGAQRSQQNRSADTIRATGRPDFVIVREPGAGPLGARVPVDLAVCSNCLKDVDGDEPRRGRYPFVSCTLCGPRYSLIRAMPYERPDTGMADFPMCEQCMREYGSVGDRRFHAQTNACSFCGPRLWCHAGDPRQTLEGSAALAAASHALREGRIVAARGVGGYQLLVDATSQSAVDRLRRRKTRPAKPLAVLVGSIDEACRLAYVDAEQRRALESPANPIVLLKSRSPSPLIGNPQPGSLLARSVHPGLDCVGLLLPSTPLHALLVREAGRPLVCTSGNREGEPLEFSVAESEHNLAGICDLWLHHDRPIEQPIDDSVVRVIAGRPVTIRLARGLAPLALPIDFNIPRLALGGHMKAAAAWCNGRQSVLGPHVGELDTLAARQRFREQFQAWQRLYRFQAERLVHDLHPDYFTTAFAMDFRGSRLAVQHHHAHVVAGMVQHGWLDRQVLGVSWDGTGLGSDGTLWGGELLLARTTGFERVGRLRPFSLPGGEAAVREPWRVALSMLHEVVKPEQALRLLPPAVEPGKCRQVQQLIGHRRLAPLSSSGGRLFDALAALILGIVESQFEGQPAMWLEAAADRSERGAYPLPLRDGELLEWDWRPLLIEVLADLRRAEAPPIMAARFHRGLAKGIVAACRRWPEMPVVLSGGVFQNQLLTEWVCEEFEEVADSPRQLGLPGSIPPNDGGLAVGQLVIAAALEE